MKPITQNDICLRVRAFSMIVALSSFAWVSQLHAAEENAPPLKQESDYRNWFEVSAGVTSINGDKAQFQRRQQIRSGAFGGVEDFHYEQDVGTNTTLIIDGRAIFDNNDYLLKLQLNNPDVGYLRAGYREFRTWYDGSGGYFPRNQAWFAPFDEKLSLDRGEFWFEGGLTLPDKPVISVKYSNIYRDGRKDSLIWGDSLLTGGLGARGVVPSFRDFDETRHIISADLTHTTGNTDWGLGVRYELQDNDNSLNIHRRPGESSERFITQREQIEGDMFNAHAFTLTQINEKLLFTSGYSFTTLDTDISGSRIYGPEYEPIYDPLFGRRQTRDEGFIHLAGGSQLRQYVLNLNLMATPWDGVYIVPAVRVEKQDFQATSEFAESNVGSAPKLDSVLEELTGESDRGLIDVAESLEARYSRMTNWVFYVRGNWLQGQGDQSERETILETGAIELSRDTDFSRFTQKYTAGANWYPLRRMNLALQYYRKIRKDDFDHRADNTINTSGNRYPAFLRGQNFDTDDVNFRVTWRVLPNLSLVSRYDFQLSTIDTEGDGLQSVQSAEISSHIISETITWTPVPRWYLQGSVNYVIDQTDTPASTPFGATNVVLNFANNYWTGSALSGYALTEKTDLEAQYFYYKSDNFSDNSQFGMPYGAAAEEQIISGGFTQRLRPNLRWSLKYAYFNSRDITSGRNEDYDGHLVYTSMRYLF